MDSNRREFIRDVTGALSAVTISSRALDASVGGVVAQPREAIKGIKAFAFDAYGTLFDVFSVTTLCEELFPGNGIALAQIWRRKQLQYSLLRSLMGRHKNFWFVTEDALVYAAKTLGVNLTSARRERLMEAYLTLSAFPDVRKGLELLKQKRIKLAILSNGEPRMLEQAAKSAGIDTLLDDIISVESVKIFKVSPKVYQLGLDRLQVSRTALGFVSSNSWDISGAASAGLTSFWIQREIDEPPDELGFAAASVVNSLTELASLVGV